MGMILFVLGIFDRVNKRGKDVLFSKLGLS